MKLFEKYVWWRWAFIAFPLAILGWALALPMMLLKSTLEKVAEWLEKFNELILLPIFWCLEKSADWARKEDDE